VKAEISTTAFQTIGW